MACIFYFTNDQRMLESEIRASQENLGFPPPVWICTSSFSHRRPPFLWAIATFTLQTPLSDQNVPATTTPFQILPRQNASGYLPSLWLPIQLLLLWPGAPSLELSLESWCLLWLRSQPRSVRPERDRRGEEISWMLFLPVEIVAHCNKNNISTKLQLQVQNTKLSSLLLWLIPIPSLLWFGQQNFWWYVNIITQFTTRCSNDQEPLGTVAFLFVEGFTVKRQQPGQDPVWVFFRYFQSLAFHITMCSSCSLMQEHCYLCCLIQETLGLSP